MNEEIKNKKWFDKKLIVVLLIFILPPVGLYALFKGVHGKLFRIVFTVIGIIFTLSFINTLTKEKTTQKDDIKVAENNSCNFNNVQIEMFNIGSNTPIKTVNIEACFEEKMVDKTLQLIEITSKESEFKVSYYKESNPKLLRFLDFDFGTGEPSKWRANKGHDLFIFRKNKDELNFIFGDKKNSKLKGTIRFY
jgi:hypothetical protein